MPTRRLALAFALLVAPALAACADDDSSDPVNRPAPSASSAAPGGRPADASVAAHVAVIEQRIAANNAHDWDTWQELHTPGVIRTAPGLGAPLVGAAALRAGIEELHGAFPDYTLTLRDAFGAGDRLVVRIHQTGTMLGPIEFGGALVPPTGRRMEQEWVALVRFEGERIAEFHEFYDNYELLGQLGLAGG
ncbi:MAG: ester cyclase [Polyangiaceae bacterium]|jgi:ketosteroid isomerase-like protein|nr:ester cyclase [Polyangiaceae bacterium]